MKSERARVAFLSRVTPPLCCAAALTRVSAAALADIPIPVVDVTDSSVGSTGFSGGTTPPGSAQPARGPSEGDTAEPASPYLEIGAGANFLEGTQFSNAAGTVTTGSQLNFDIGPAVTGAVGYAFGNGWRGEFELGYRNSPAKDLTLPSGAVVGGSATLTANVSAYSYMANAIYDFDLARYGYARWVPHVGGGIGAVNLQPNRAPAATVFGGQAIAGVEYVVTPTLLVGLDYRYVGTTSSGFTFTQNAVTVGRTANTSFNDHSVLFTLRWKFGGQR
jgi:OmpA-OmpF porin, OOP family